MSPVLAARLVIGSVWVFHGVYSKLLDRIPRHRQIVGRILGDGLAIPATRLIGVLELLLGCWIFSGFAPLACAVLQTVALMAMNTLEIIFARDLLLSPLGMVALNAGLLALVWWTALAAP